MDWYLREGFVWDADEMGVCRGYVGVFIDSPDTQTHDPSSSRKWVKGFLLLRWASEINSPDLASMDGPGITIFIILSLDRVFLLNASESGSTRQRPSPQSSEANTNTSCPPLTSDNPPPRSQQIGMGSNTYSRFLDLSTNRKKRMTSRTFFKISPEQEAFGISKRCAAWRVELFSFFRFAQRKRCAMSSAHAQTRTFGLKVEWPLRAGLIRKDLHLHINPLSYVSLCINYEGDHENVKVPLVLIVQEVILLYFLFFFDRLVS